VVSVAVTRLDPSRAVTAEINKEGVLSIDTWKVGAGGVVSQRGIHRPKFREFTTVRG
jgi:hypothetical protein